MSSERAQIMASVGSPLGLPNLKIQLQGQDNMDCANDCGEMILRQYEENVIVAGIPVTYMAEHFVCLRCGMKCDDFNTAQDNHRAMLDAYDKIIGERNAESL